MDFDIYTEMIGKCLEGEYTGRLGISVSRRFVSSIEEEV